MVDQLKLALNTRLPVWSTPPFHSILSPLPWWSTLPLIITNRTTHYSSPLLSCMFYKRTIQDRKSQENWMWNVFPKIISSTSSMQLILKAKRHAREKKRGTLKSIPHMLSTKESNAYAKWLMLLQSLYYIHIYCTICMCICSFQLFIRPHVISPIRPSST